MNGQDRAAGTALAIRVQYDGKFQLSCRRARQLPPTASPTASLFKPRSTASLFKMLPGENGQLQYRIRSTKEAFDRMVPDRMVPEFNLIAADQCPTIHDDQARRISYAFCSEAAAIAALFMRAICSSNLQNTGKGGR